MEASPAPAAQAGGGRPPNARGRGGRSRGRGGNAGGNTSRGARGDSRSQPKGNSEDSKDNVAAAVDPASLPKAPVTIPAAGGADGEEDDVEAEVCFICASPVIHQSVAPCNHRTCHICSLRMRALYKGKECAHCRVCRTSKSDLLPIEISTNFFFVDTCTLCHLHR